MPQGYLAGEKLYPGNGKRRRSRNTYTKKNQGSEHRDIIQENQIHFADPFINREGWENAEETSILFIVLDRRLVDHSPVKPHLPDHICKLIKLDRFYDITVDSKVIALHDVPLLT